MSLLINKNNSILNDKTILLNVEKGKIIKKETEDLMQAFKALQINVIYKISLLNLMQKDKKNFSKLMTKKIVSPLDPIFYVIHVSVLKKNTIVQLSKTNGQIQLFCSASSSLKLSNKQKTMQPKVLLSLLKYFLSKVYFITNKPVALHSKYIKKNLLKLIVRKLGKDISIQTIKYSNFFPHNGCRPKKIKRLKRKRTKTKTKKLITYKKKKVWKLLTLRRLRKDTLSK